MSLELLLESRYVEQLVKEWPEQPQVLPLPANGRELIRLINADTIDGILDTGCFPPTDVNVVKNDTVRHPRLFTSADRLDAAKLRRWRERGYTIQMRHLERWLPAMAAVTKSIQRQTGCTNYVTAFITPGGHQGLGHHWDQYLSLVVQLAGTKTWDLWEPKVSHPIRNHQTTVQLWQNEWIERWNTSGPDMSFDLNPGQTLILPRGWVHNPYNKDATESVHLTFVIKERTPLWIAEHLTAAAINDEAFRRSIPTNDLAPERLANRIELTRDRLIRHLTNLDTHTFASILRTAADTEVDLDLI
jgi:ribosomal protein L16 Arg81 hydroxylase